MTTITMKLKKETKGAVAYIEVNAAGQVVEQGYKIGTLYIRKDGIDGTPDMITVTYAPVVAAAATAPARAAPRRKAAAA